MSKQEVFFISMAFNLYWLAAILLNDLAVPVLFAAYVSLFYFKKEAIPYSLVIAVSGIVVDSLLTFVGVFRFEEEAFLPAIAGVSLIPLWLYFLWLGFAAYAWLMKDWVKNFNSWLVALVTSIAGTLSYYAAERFEVVDIHNSAGSVLGLLFVWFVAGWLIQSLMHVVDKRNQKLRTLLN